MNKSHQTSRSIMSRSPWEHIGAMRNKLIHEYFGSDVDIVWHTVQEDLGPLEAAVKEIAKEFSD